MVVVAEADVVLADEIANGDIAKYMFFNLLLIILIVIFALYPFCLNWILHNLVTVLYLLIFLKLGFGDDKLTLNHNIDIFD